MVHSTALSLIEPELWAINILHCGNRDFDFFAPVTLFDLDPMTFIYELDPYSPEVHRMRICKLPTSLCSKVIV